MTDDQTRAKHLEVGEWLQAADEVSWRQARESRLPLDDALTLTRATISFARRKAVEALEGICSLHPDDVALWRAQALMAEMLGQEYPEHDDALSEIAGLLATAAGSMRRVNEALAEKRKAA